MGASIYISRLAFGLLKMGRHVERVDPNRGRLVFISRTGDRVSIHARYVKGRLTITETTSTAA